MIQWVNQHFDRSLTTYDSVVTLYRQLVMSANWVATQVGPTLSVPISLLARVMRGPNVYAFANLKRTLRWLKGQPNYGILYERHRVYDWRHGDFPQMIGQVDASFADDLSTRTSQGGYILSLEHMAPYMWKTGSSKGVMDSTSMAEIEWASKFCRHARHHREIASFLRVLNPAPIPLYIDNAAAVLVGSSGVRHFSPRLKHLDIKQKYLREAHRIGIVQILDIDTLENASDVLTKPASLDMLCRHFHALHGERYSPSRGVTGQQG